MSVKRHKHWFTSIVWQPGRFGRQDIHLHSCIQDSRDGENCSRVLVGPGKWCEGEKGDHWRATLGDESLDLAHSHKTEKAVAYPGRGRKPRKPRALS